MADAFFTLGWLVVLALWIAGVWQFFTKAGRPGWVGLIPFYNGVVVLRIARRPLWWLLLLLVPIANLVVWFLIGQAVARSYGKGAAFGVGLALFPFLFYPVLGWLSAQYQPAEAA